MKRIVMTGLLAIAPFANADKAWHGEGDLAFNKASGNSDSEALLANLKLIYEREKWKHTGKIEAINTSEDDQRSAESYVFKAKSDYALSERSYAFAAFRYEDNRFSGYEYQTSLAGGMGIHLINDGVTLFDLEGGLGYRSSEEQGTGETLDEAVAQGTARYHRQLTETTKFESDFNVEAGQDNTYMESVIGVKVKINSRLSLKMAYTVKHNTDVPDGTKNTDTLSSVGLNYSF